MYGTRTNTEQINVKLKYLPFLSDICSYNWNFSTFLCVLFSFPFIEIGVEVRYALNHNAERTYYVRLFIYLLMGGGSQKSIGNGKQMLKFMFYYIELPLSVRAFQLQFLPTFLPCYNARAKTAKTFVIQLCTTFHTIISPPS